MTSNTLVPITLSEIITEYNKQFDELQWARKEKFRLEIENVFYKKYYVQMACINLLEFLIPYYTSSLIIDCLNKKNFNEKFLYFCPSKNFPLEQMDSKTGINLLKGTHICFSCGIIGILATFSKSHGSGSSAMCLDCVPKKVKDVIRRSLLQVKNQRDAMVAHKYFEYIFGNYNTIEILQLCLKNLYIELNEGLKSIIYDITNTYIESNIDNRLRQISVLNNVI